MVIGARSGLSYLVTTRLERLPRRAEPAQQDREMARRSQGSYQPGDDLETVPHFHMEQWLPELPLVSARPHMGRLRVLLKSPAPGNAHAAIANISSSS